MYKTPLRSDEIYHFGVKGMHWGIRRYQPYPDGSKRKGKEVGEARRKPKINSKASTKPKHSESVKDLSDDEINRRINRLNLEKRYHEAMMQSTHSINRNSPEMKTAGAYVKKKLAYAGDTFVNSLIQGGTRYAANKVLKSVLKDYSGDSGKKKEKK